MHVCVIKTKLIHPKIASPLNTAKQALHSAPHRAISFPNQVRIRKRPSIDKSKIEKRERPTSALNNEFFQHNILFEQLFSYKRAAIGTRPNPTIERLPSLTSAVNGPIGASKPAATGKTLSLVPKFPSRWGIALNQVQIPQGSGLCLVSTASVAKNDPVLTVVNRSWQDMFFPWWLRPDFFFWFADLFLVEWSYEILAESANYIGSDTPSFLQILFRRRP